MTSRRVRRLPCLLAAILTLLLAFAPMARAGTDDGTGDGAAAPSAPVATDVAATGTESTPAASVPPADGGDDGEAPAPGAQAPSDGSAVDDSSGDSGSTTVGEPGTSVYGKNLLRPVALAGGVLGLTVVGLMLFRRL